MGRINKNLNGAFSNIVSGTPAYYTFMNEQSKLSPPKPELSRLNNEYKGLLTKHVGVIEKLATLELLIIQHRILENFSEKDVKVYKLRNYLYARLPFSRLYSNSKDIRVIVGKTEQWGTNIKKLRTNQMFMNIVNDKLKTTIKSEINKTKAQYNEDK